MKHFDSATHMNKEEMVLTSYT